jgi:hypothetical protein
VVTTDYTQKNNSVGGKYTGMALTMLQTNAILLDDSEIAADPQEGELYLMSQNLTEGHSTWPFVTSENGYLRPKVGGSRFVCHSAGATIIVKPCYGEWRCPVADCPVRAAPQPQGATSRYFGPAGCKLHPRCSLVHKECSCKYIFIDPQEGSTLQNAFGRGNSAMYVVGCHNHVGFSDLKPPPHVRFEIRRTLAAAVLAKGSPALASPTGHLHLLQSEIIARFVQVIRNKYEKSSNVVTFALSSGHFEVTALKETP